VEWKTRTQTAMGSKASYEYRVERLATSLTPFEVEGWINSRSESGWRLVTVAQDYNWPKALVYFFERKLPRGKT
jgi:hypothetical protein